MGAKVSVDRPIDVNTASLESLRDGVVGLGPVLAGRVIAYREEHGPFADLSELTHVRGIGPQLLARIAGQVTVGEVHPPMVEGSQTGEASLGRGSLDAQGTATEGPGVEPERGELPTKEASLGASGLPKASSVEERDVARRDSLGQKFLLVLLGGLLGMTLTLLIMLVVSGTLRFASRREVVALSRNLSAVRSEQDLSRQRIEQLTERVSELERQVKRLEGLSARVTRLESDLATIRDDTEELGRAFEALRREVTQELGQLNRRIAEMQSVVQRIQERIRRFDAFFASLRDLLDEMESASSESGLLPTPQR